MAHLPSKWFIVLTVLGAGAYLGLALAFGWPSSALVALMFFALLASLFYTRRVAYVALGVVLVYATIGVVNLSRDWFASSINVALLMLLSVGFIEIIAFFRHTQQAQQDNLHAWLDHSAEALLFCTATYRIVRANPRVADLLGQSPDRLRGQSLADLLGQALPSGRLTFAFNHAQGERREIETLVVPYSALGQPTQLMVSLRDVTEARQQERERATHSLVVQNTDNIVIITDPQGHVEWVNPSFERVTGYRLAEVRGRSPGLLLQGPLTNPDTVARVRAALQRREPLTEELLNYHKNGRPYWLELRINPVFDTQGTLVNFVAIESDITERKRVEQRLAAQYEASRALAETSQMENALPRFLSALGQHLGWEVVELWTPQPTEPASLHCLAAWHTPTDLPPQTSTSALRFEVGLELADQVWRTTRALWVENAVAHPDFTLMASAGWRTGGAVPLLSRNQAVGVLVGAHRAPPLWDKTALDVMTSLGAQLAHYLERQQAETALRTSQRLVEQITQALPEIVLVFDLATQRPLFVGGAVTATLGISAHLLFLEFTELIHTLAHPEDAAQVQAMFDHMPNLTESDTTEMEFRARHADGSWRWLYARHTLFARDANGLPAQILGLYSNITVQRHLREERTHQIELLRGLTQMEHHLLAEADEAHALPPALALLGMMLRADGVYVMELTAPNALTVRHAWSLTAPATPATPLTVSANALAFWHDNQPLFRTYATLGEAAQPTVWAIAEWPLPANETCWGVLRLEARRAEPNWSEAERLVLTTAASALSTALARFRSERALQAERDFAVQVLNAMGQGLVVVNEQSAITYANPAITAIFGYDPDELLGKISYYFVEPDQIDVFSRQHTLRRQGETTRYEVRLRHRDGSTRQVSIHGTPILKEGAYRGSIMVITDLTESKHMEAAIYTSQAQLLQAIEQANQLALSAEAANRAKSDFIANISHEIRTPMNAVLGILENLQDEPLNDTQAEWVRVAHHAAHSLLTLINDLLDFSKLEAGKFVLEHAPFALATLLEGVSQLLAPLAHRKGLTLTVQVDPATPAWLAGDALRVRQILLNLAGNAIKFTQHGQVQVKVCPEPFAAQPTTLRFEVSDTGPGLSAATRAGLFQPFVQADSSTTRQHGGTGLGLAISRNLVTLMGGQIGVESVPGAGSTFWFTVPFAPAEPPPPVVAPNPPPVPVTTANRHVLLAEDNKANQQVAALHLKKLGCTLELAEDGAAALAAVQADPNRFALVLMDCQMPHMDGFEATRRLRAWETETGQPRLPVVALTANASEADRQQCQEAGMDDYLTKPVSRATLEETLKHWARSRQTAGSP